MFCNLKKVPSNRSVFKKLHEIPNLYLIFWCGNFVETHSFSKVSVSFPEALGKLYVCKKSAHQEIGEISYILKQTYWKMQVFSICV